MRIFVVLLFSAISFSVFAQVQAKSDSIKHPGIIIPKMISPNSEKNDVFYIQNLPQGSSLRVYNRWGMEIYSEKNYQNNWTAAKIEAGTYYYLLQLPGGKKEDELGGAVTIIK